VGQYVTFVSEITKISKITSETAQDPVHSASPSDAKFSIIAREIQRPDAKPICAKLVERATSIA
jgi:hypothetical protein